MLYREGKEKKGRGRSGLRRDEWERGIESGGKEERGVKGKGGIMAEGREVCQVWTPPISFSVYT